MISYCPIMSTVHVFSSIFWTNLGLLSGPDQDPETTAEGEADPETLDPEDLTTSPAEGDLAVVQDLVVIVDDHPALVVAKKGKPVLSCHWVISEKKKKLWYFKI